jgi:MFS family permease
VAIGGAIPSVLVFVSLITQLVMWNLNHTKLMIVGQLCLTAGLAFLALAYFIPSLIIIFLSAIISGVAVGTTFLGGLGTINTISPATRRGDVTSSFYAVGYSALGFPIVLLGFTVQLLNIFVGVQIFAIIIGAIAVPNMIWIAAHKKLFQRAAESTS